MFGRDAFLYVTLELKANNTTWNLGVTVTRRRLYCVLFTLTSAGLLDAYAAEYSCSGDRFN